MTSALVRAYLITRGLNSGWTILEGGLSDLVTGPQIAVIDRGGLPPVLAHGETGPLRAGIQVLVRGDAEAYAAASAKATAVWSALHRAAFAGVMSLEGINNPIWIGFEPDTRKPRWSLNFIAWTA